MEQSSFAINRNFKFKKADLETLKDSKIDFLRSPEYYVSTFSNARYHFSVYPNGDFQIIRGGASIFLFFDVRDGTSVEADVQFSVASANFLAIVKQTYKRCEGWGKWMCSASELFDPTNNYFVGDELIISVKGVLKINSPQTINYPISGKWEIPEASLVALKTDSDALLKSKMFNLTSDSDVKYFLGIMPNREIGEYHESRVYFCLHIESEAKIEAVMNVAIESANFSYTVQNIFTHSEGAGFLLCFTEDLFNPDKRYIVDGKLVIKVLGTLMIEKEKELTAMSLEKGIVQKGYHRGKNFTLVVGDKTIKVHKHVLQAASPAFTGMFASQMKEVKEKKMVIVDFEYEIVHAAMKLLYSASVPTTFTFEQMLSLLQFSDKYDIQLIKDRIQDYLIKRLSPTNVCIITNFTTNTVIAPKLHEKCLEYLIGRLKEEKAVHGLRTLEKVVMAKILLAVSTQNL